MNNNILYHHRQVSELLYSPATFGVDMSVKHLPKPRARYRPMLAVIKNTLWLYGGIVEIADVEIALDDMWRVDLAKCEGWECLKDNSGG